MRTKTRAAIAATVMTVVGATSVATATPSAAGSGTCYESGGKIGVVVASVGDGCITTPLGPLPLVDTVVEIVKDVLESLM